MNSQKAALCGLLTALAVVLMVLAGAMGIGTFAGPLLAMAVLLPVLEEYGSGPAMMSYAAAALLGLLLVPEPELALVYAAFGWYPVLRPRLDRRLSAPVPRLLVKLALSTGVILLLYGLLLRLLGLTADLQSASPLFNLILLLLGDAVFLLADRALARLTLLWRCKLRKRFLRK